LFILGYTRPALPIKVMIANYHYEVGKKSKNKQLIKKSSLLGLPKAKKDLDENTSEVRSSGYSGGYSYSRGGGYYAHASSDPNCYRCGAPMPICRC